MIIVDAPSRLHFGLFHVPAEDSRDERRFGGVGLMIASPRVVVRLSDSDHWAATGPLAERALHFAKAASADAKQVRKFHIEVLDCPEEHTGLGVGTQLGLAVAAAVRCSLGERRPGPKYLALLVGRGERSAVGTRGFGEGGFLVDAGKLTDSPIGTIVARYPFPTEWPILLIRPPIDPSWFGQQEFNVFRRQRTLESSVVQHMAKLTLLEMMPAVIEHNYCAFANAIFEFNRAAGTPFQKDQGGIYAHPQIESIINTTRAFGIQAVGQSSWGPTVFAICDSADVSKQLQQHLEQQFPDCQFLLSQADNHGAMVLEEPSEGNPNDIG